MKKTDRGNCSKGKKKLIESEVSKVECLLVTECQL